MNTAQLALVAGATAQIACQIFLDFVLTGLGIFPKQCQRVHNHTGIAEAALLRALVRNKGTKFSGLLLQALHGGYPVAVSASYQNGAAQHGLIIEKHGAQAAVGGVAATLYAVAALVTHKI